MDTRIESELSGKSITRLLLKYSGPAIIESVAVSLYNIVDSIFIGHDVGAMALAALAVALPLMNLIIGFCTLVSAGGAAIISIYLGRKDMEKAQSTINNIVLLCLLHAVVFAGAMLIFLDPLLHLFGATDVTIGFARRYMRIILIATPISYMFLGLNNIMRATGYPKKAMMSAIFSVIANVALCPIFITRLHWGIEGAAVATVCGQLVALIWCVSHFARVQVPVKFNRKARWFVPEIVKKIYSIGLSPFLMNLTASVVVVFLNHALLTQGGAEGNYYVGAYGVLNRITMVFILVVQGLSMGMQPIIGYNYGAGHWPRVRATLYRGIAAGVAITVIGWIVTECFPDQMSDIFTTNAELIRLDRTGFRIYFLFYPLVGAQIIIQNFFQYIDRPWYSILQSMTRQLIFLLPFLIVLPHLLGPTGVWWSMACSDLLAFLVSLAILLVMMRRLDRQYAPNTGPAATH